MSKSAIIVDVEEILDRVRKSEAYVEEALAKSKENYIQTKMTENQKFWFWEKDHYPTREEAEKMLTMITI